MKRLFILLILLVPMMVLAQRVETKVSPIKPEFSKPVPANGLTQQQIEARKAEIQARHEAARLKQAPQPMRISKTEQTLRDSLKMQIAEIKALEGKKTPQQLAAIREAKMKNTEEDRIAKLRERIKENKVQIKALKGK